MHMTLGKTDPPGLAPAVETLLARLRRRIRQYLWLQGCAAVVIWLGVAFWVTLAADWFFEPSPTVRGVMLSTAVAVLLVVVLRWIVRRAFVPISRSNAATVLERRFPELNDGLLTAVLLSGRTLDDAEVSAEMLDLTRREAAERIGIVDLQKVFNWRPLWLHGMAAVLLALSVVFFASLFPDAFGVWARRNLALSDELWPRRTRLEMVGFDRGVRKVARGADLEVVARADARMPHIPDVVEVRYQTAGGGRGRATMDRRGITRSADDRFQEYVYTFRSVLADVKFDIVGGDDRVGNLQIQAVDSPTISRMTLHCELPSYIGRRQPPLPVTGVMQVPQGSRVTVEAADANKELVRVEVNTLLDDRPLPAVVLSNKNLADDRRGFSYQLPPVLKDTTLLFALTDADGLKGREPVRLVLVPTPDQSPQMAVALDGIGTAVTAQARVPVAGAISDDYGIDRVWFEQAIDQHQPNKQPIAELKDGPMTFTVKDAALELAPWKLKVGQKVSICVGAADRCDLGRGPNVASSEHWVLDVVSPEQLRAMLEARELVLRQRFERMIQEVTETRDVLARMPFAAGNLAAATEVVAPSIGTNEAAQKKGADAKKSAAAEPGDPSTDAASREHTLRYLGVESSLTNSRKGAQEVLGVAESFDDIRKQLVNNRIDTVELNNRLQHGIAEPLRQAANTLFVEWTKRLELLQAAIDDGQNGPKRRDRARQQADEIVLTMRRVLDRMMEMEDFNAVIEMLRNIVDAQKKVHQETQQRHKEKLRELLSDGNKTAKPGAAEKLVQEERAVADKFKHFENLLLRMAELSALGEPQRAALLKKAVAQSKEELLAVRLERVVEMLGKGQLSQAMENQTELERHLQSLLDLLMSENREKRLRDEKARIREYLKRLSGLIKQQKDIQSRAGNAADPQRLAGEQQRLGQKTGELAQDIRRNEEPEAKDKPDDGKGEDGKRKDESKETPGSQGDQKDQPGKGQKGGKPQNQKDGKPGDQRDGGQDQGAEQQPPPPEQNPARKRIETAQQRMKEAESKLKEAQREGATEKQEQAIRELEKAKAALEEILRQLREEEVERVLAMLEARFRKMLQMQEAVYEATLRLDRVPEGERTHNHEIEASRLSGKQSQIVVEVEKASLLLREDGTAVAFPEAIDQMRDDMNQIVTRLAQGKVNKVTQGIEEDVLAALKEMIESLQKAQKDRDKAGKQGPAGQGGGDSGEPPLVDSLSELKMIRALQMRVNNRTERYSKMIEGEQAENAELVDALKRLADREKKIHRVTRDLQMGKNQ